jgi:hypothetical protein
VDEVVEGVVEELAGLAVEGAGGMRYTLRRERKIFHLMLMVQLLF